LILAGLLASVLGVVLFQALMPWGSERAPTTATPTVASAPESTPPRVGAPALGDKSIAILPFVNLSPLEDDAFFADGLTEELLNVLAQIRGLSVISRTSSFAFKAKDTPLPEIAEQLGVRHILEGSVRRDGASVRVTAQLIDVSTDTHLWTETYERQIESVFALQTEIARAIANALDVEIATAFPHNAPTPDMDAYRSYLEARELFRLRRSDKDLEDSEALYRRAVERDPNFALAYSELGLTYSAIIIRHPSKLDSLTPLVESAAQSAIRLRPDLAQPHAALAGLYRHRLDWEKMRFHAFKALSLDSSDSISLFIAGVAQTTTGHISEASRFLEQAQRLDPLFESIQLGVLAVAFARGDDRACLESATRLVRSGGPYFARTGESYLAYYERKQGNIAAAERHYRAWAALSGEKPLEVVVTALQTPSAIPAALSAVDAARKNGGAFPTLLWMMLDAPAEHIDAILDELEHRNLARVAGSLAFAWRTIDTEATREKFKLLVQKVGLYDHWRKHGWPDRCRPKGEDDFECD
jgi:TolB-like protein